MTGLLLFCVDLVLAAVTAYGLSWVGTRLAGFVSSHEGGDDGPGGGGWRRRPTPPPPRPHGDRMPWSGDPRPHATGPRREPVSGGRTVP
jgi:hypothetical protein